ncbi:ufaA1, partial [Cucurbita argyrosperma subsp. argyrosperma]
MVIYFLLGIVVSSTVYRNYCICKHTLRKNTIAQARKNISRHYDLVSNELFSLFLDDTMMYSCAIIKLVDEDLRIAQLRKISVLIEKASINEKHKLKQTGCHWHYFVQTTIEICPKNAQKRVQDLGLQMIKAVGHEFMGDFFGSYESVSRKMVFVEHLENIGIHYYRTLRCLDKEFLEQSKQNT